MKTKRSLFAAAAVLSACAIAFWLSTSIQGGEETYEIHPQVAVPYGYTPNTDTYRLIDLIEYLTDQNIQITQDQLVQLNQQLNTVAEKLDSINNKLKRLSARMAGIEKALGIEPDPPAKQKSQKKSAQ
jgi:hypothetical protein